ncbi:MAG: hypothetical protein ACYC97_09295 [Metallibacterium sp.]
MSGEPKAKWYRYQDIDIMRRNMGACGASGLPRGSAATAPITSALTLAAPHRRLQDMTIARHCRRVATAPPHLPLPDATRP